MSHVETGASRAQRVFVPLLTLAVTVLFFLIVKGFVVAVLLAAIFATMAAPLYRRLEQWLGGRSRVAAGVTVVFLVLLVLIPVLAFFAVLAGEAAEISTNAVGWVRGVLANPDATAGWIQDLPFGESIWAHREAILQKFGEIMAGLGAWVARALAGASAGTIGFFLQVFVFLYAMVFFLASGARRQHAIVDLFPLRPEDREELVTTFLGVSRATIKGTLIIGIVQGAMVGGAFAVLDLHGAFFWGAVAGVLSVIPGIGPALVYVPASILLASTGRLGAGIGFLLYGAVIISNIDNVLRPLLVGKETAMPDLLVLVSTLGGLAFFGAPGIVLGPAVAGLVLVTWRIYRKTYADVLEPEAAAAGAESR